MSEKFKKSGDSIKRKRSTTTNRVVKVKAQVQSNLIERERDEQQRKKVRSVPKNHVKVGGKLLLTTVSKADVPIERKRDSERRIRMSATPPRSAQIVKKTREKAGFSLRIVESKSARREPSNKHVAHTTSTHPDSSAIHNVSTDPHHFPQENTNLDEQGHPDPLPSFLTLSSKPNDAKPGAGFCDKLSCTFSPFGFNGEQFGDKVNMLAEPNARGYVLYSIAGACSRIYKHSFSLKNANGENIALIQCSPRNPNAHFLRFELNPRAIGVDGMYEFKRVMRAFFGRGFKGFLLDGNITRLDSAVDVYKIRPDDLMVFSTSARQSGLFQRSFGNDRLETFVTETYTLGSLTSDYFARIYDKSAQLWIVKAQEVDQLITRIEAKLKPRGGDGKTLRVGDIMSVRNPFATLSIAYYPTSDHTNYVFNLFIAAARAVGTEEAMKMIADKRVRSKFWGLLQDHVPEWWSPGKHWAEVLKDLELCRLFPDDIFKQ